MDSEKIIAKIVEETELSEKEVEEQIEEKMEEFSGLVSEEGAVHLVAKEAGLDLATAAKQDLKVENIVPDMRRVEMKARVVRVLEPNTFEREDGEEGKVQNVILGDDTGTLRMTLWDEQTQIAEKVSEDDAIHIIGAYTVEDNRGNAEIRLGDDAQVKMAEDDEVPEVKSTDHEVQEVPIRGVMNENAEYKVKGMIMDIYTSNPFYRTCPECGTSVRKAEDDDEYKCEEHGEVDPDYALAISAVVDDGTGNIRVVFFRDRARELLGIDEEVEEEGDAEAIEEAAEEAIGTELIIEGRARNNDYFGSLEMIANSVEELETEEQIEELLEMMEA